MSNSNFFYKINKRLLLFPYIEQFLDSNSLIFKFNKNVNPTSKMKAKYIMENTICDEIAYICIDKIENIDEYFCRSFFPKTEVDYTKGHTKYTLLYKEKINIKTQENIIQYDKLTPKG